MKCNTCQEELPRSAFHEYRLTQCKKCFTKYRTDRYVEFTKRLCDYLLAHSCVDCGESDPVVLQFDHVRGTKVANVTSLIQNSSWQKVLDEIKKCSVRCGNCHIRKTAFAQRNGRGSYKLEYLAEIMAAKVDASTPLGDL